MIRNQSPQQQPSNESAQELAKPDCLDSRSPSTSNLNGLGELLRKVQSGDEISVELQALYFGAVNLGLIHHTSLSEATDRVRRMVSEGQELSGEQSRIIEERETLRTREALLEAVVTKTAPMAYNRYIEEDRIYHDLVRESRSSWSKLQELFNDVLLTYPKLQRFFGEPGETISSRLLKANTDRIRAHSAALDIQLKAVQNEVEFSELNQQIRHLTAAEFSIQQQLNKFDKELASCGELQPNAFGYAALTSLGKTFLKVSVLTDCSVALNQREELSLLREMSRAVYANVSRAVGIQRYLEDVIGYPQPGAEIASWYLLSNEGSSQTVSDGFHEANTTVLRHVKPSYGQLLLSLEVQSMGSDTFSQLSSIITAAGDIPNFEPAHRYLVAREVSLIPGDKIRQKAALEFFVEKLTGPLTEHLEAFERFELAAKLSQIESNPEHLYNRFEDAFRKIREKYPVDIFKGMLAALLVVKMDCDDNLGKIEVSLNLCRELYGEREALDLVLECAFIGLLPGSPAHYLICLDMAREQLEAQGYNRTAALARALPAAAPALRKAWAAGVHHEALLLAQRVKQLDEELEGSADRGVREEIQRTRLEEELLNSIEKIHALYGQLNAFSVQDLWLDMSRAATGRDVVSIDRTLNSGTSSSITGSERQLTTQERITDLLEAAESLRRQQREAELGSEYRS